MGFVPAPNVVQLEAIYSADNEICENVYHYQFAAPPTALDMNNLIDAFKTWETDHAAALRTPNVWLLRCRARDLSSADGIIVDRDILPVVVGTDTGLHMPNNVSLAIAWRTPFGGRSFRGRTFHLGLSGNAITANRVSTTYTTELAALYTLLINVDPAGSPPLVVVSRRHNKADRATAVCTAVTAVTVNPVVDSMRRRLPEHNRHH